MDTQQDPTFGAPPSGLPPLAWLSGLNLGQVGMSGAQDQSLSGSGGTRGMTPGQSPGLGLDELSQLLAAQADSGTAGVTSGGSAPFATQAIGQQPTLPGGYGIAGQTGQQGAAGGSQQTAQGAAAGSIDPIAMLQKILGIAQKEAGLLGGGGTGTGTGAGPGAGTGAPGGYGTAGQSGTGGTQTPGVFQTGIASPTVQQFGANTLSDYLRSIPEGTATVGQPTITGYGSPDFTLTNQTGPGVAISPIQQAYNAALEAGLSNDQITQILNQPGGLEALSQFSPGQGFEMTAVGGSGSPTGGYATAGQNTASGGQSSLSGQVGGGISGALGLLNLIQGGQSGNVAQQIGGGLQGVGGLTQLLQSSPQLASALGLSGSTLSGLGAGVGGLGGLLGLAQGIQSGNPLQIGTGALGALQGGASLYSTLTGASGTAAAPIASFIASQMPGLASALVSAAGTGGAAAGAAGGATVAASAPAVSAAIGALGAAAAPIVMAITSYISDAQRKEALSSGMINNPIAGNLYSGATAGVGKDLAALQQLQQAGGIGAADTSQLVGLLPDLVNNLGPYFATAQLPGGGAARASSTVTGEPYAYGGRRTPYGNAAEYTANENQAQQGVMDIVQELLRRGVPYEQLGQLPVSNAFTNQTMDMYNPLQDLYGSNRAQFDAQARQMLQSVAGANQVALGPGEFERMAVQGLYPSMFGYTQDAQGNWTTTHIPLGGPTGDYLPLQPGQLTPELLFQAAQGAAGRSGAPDSATHAGGLVSAMYGGPLWAALARMGGPASPFWGQIQQHFNPWAAIGGFSPQQLTASLQPLLADQVRFGGGLGGGLPGNSEGTSPSPTGDGVSSGVW